MNIANQLAKIMFVRKDQFGQAPMGTDPNSFHIYEPGRVWPQKHREWDALTDQEKNQWLEQAESWLLNLSEKSPTTYSYILTNFKDDMTALDELEDL
jgi:hypothetical protein